MRFFFFAASFSQITTAHHVVIRLWAQTQKQRHLSCFDITKKLPRRAPRQFLCASRRIDTPPGAAAAYPCPAPAKPLGWCQIYRRVDRDRPQGELFPAVFAAGRLRRGAGKITETLHRRGNNLYQAPVFYAMCTEQVKKEFV